MRSDLDLSVWLSEETLWLTAEIKMLHKSRVGRRETEEVRNKRGSVSWGTSEI